MFLDLTKSAALRLSTALLLALPFPLFAQAQAVPPEPEEEVQLDPVSVYADRQGSAVTDVPASVVVVEGADLQARGLTTMKDITRYMPGVSVQRTTSGANPYGSYTGFTIRGVGGNRVQMMLDGSRTPEAPTDGTRDYFDFSFTKQVDVVKGPSSVLWGADALAGVVAVETLDPEDILLGADRGGIARIGHDGLNGETGVSAAFAQRFGPSLGMMLGVSRTQGHEARLRNARADGGIYGCPREISAGATHCGQMDPTDLTATRVLAKAVWTPAEAHRVEFTFDALQRDTDVDVRWGLGRVISSNNGTIGDTLLSNRVAQDLKRQRYAIEHTWTLNQPWIEELRTTLSYAPGGFERQGFRRNLQVSGDMQTRRDLLKYDEKFFELDIQAKSRFETGTAKHELVWGFDGDLSKTDFKRIQTTTNLTTGVVTEVKGTGFNFANADTRRADLYLQDKITLLGGALEVTPGLRYATYSLDPRPDADYVALPGQEPKKRSDEKVLKSLAALYRFGEGWQVWGRYGEGFKMPTAEQMFLSNPGSRLLPNPDLQPEYVKAFELGLRKEFDRGVIGVTAFKSDYDNFIKSFEPVTVAGTTYYSYKNYQKVNIWGVELNGAYQINDSLRMSGSATWQRGTQVVAATSAKTDHTLAPLQATLGLTYDLPERGLSFDVLGSFGGKFKRTASATAFKPAGYGVIDTYLRWTVSETAVLNLGVKNLFDKRYFEPSAANYSLSTSAGNAQTDPLELQTGAGRVFTMSLDMKF